MNAAWLAVLGGAGAVASIALVRSLVRFARVETVFEHEHAYRFRRGMPGSRLSPGRHWRFGTFSTIVKVDTRAAAVTVPSQEVLSADGVPIKVSLACRYEVVDGALALLRNQDHLGALYLELQVALRQVLAALPVEQLLKSRSELDSQVRGLAAPKVESLGVRLLEVALKDLALPGDLKKLFTQSVKARQDGLAALERARGETAALRNLGNAARILEKSPVLLQLRALQSLADAPGGSVVIGVGGAPVLLPPGGRNGHAPPSSDAAKGKR